MQDLAPKLRGDLKVNSLHSLSLCGLNPAQQPADTTLLYPLSTNQMGETVQHDGKGGRCSAQEHQDIVRQRGHPLLTDVCVCIASTTKCINTSAAPTRNAPAEVPWLQTPCRTSTCTWDPIWRW